MFPMEVSVLLLLRTLKLLCSQMTDTYLLVIGIMTSDFIVEEVDDM